MADLQVTNAFSDGDIVSASAFNTNYSDIVTYINNRNSASATWDNMYCTHATNVPLTANNSSGTQDIVQLKDNGTTVLSVNDGGIVNFQYQDYALIVPYNAWLESISSGATVEIEFGGSATQNHSSMDTDGRFTAQAAGKYLVTGMVAINGASSAMSGTIRMSVYKNGSQFAKVENRSINFFCRPSIECIVNMSAGDYVELFLTNSSGTTIQAWGVPDGITSADARFSVMSLG